MENILILNATPRNRINREVKIPRANYDCLVQAASNCYKIQDILLIFFDLYCKMCI